MIPFGAAIFGCEGLEITASERDFYRDYNPFGFILFARNVGDAAQLTKLCADLREAVGRDAPILVDQEGGRVQRLRPPLARDFLPPLDHAAALGENAERGFYLRHRIIAHELRTYGLDTSCAPMLDVAREETHPFLRNRCYSDDSETVAQLGRAAVNGLLDGGVLPVVKHIPGHGRAAIDSHFELPRTDASKEALEQDFKPFRALNDLPMAMTAHVVYAAYDDRSSTTSRVMTDVIRNDIGFVGLLMCDDLSMEALSGTVGERAEASLTAGCDVILHCNGKLSEMQQVAAQAGNMTDQAQQRAERVLAARRAPAEVDIAALSAELEALSSG